MSLIKEKFSRGKPLICYFMAGYPSVEDSYKTARALIEAGADILEVGVPFSDPVADGPTIQVAHEKAVKDGVTPLDVLNLTERLKREFPDVPLILMTYYNPIFIFGEERFCKLAKEKGVDGFIVPDLPPEEASGFKKVANSLGLSTVFLLAPTSDEDRIRLISKYSDEFYILRFSNRYYRCKGHASVGRGESPDKQNQVNYQYPCSCRVWCFKKRAYANFIFSC